MISPFLPLSPLILLKWSWNGGSGEEEDDEEEDEEDLKSI